LPSPNVRILHPREPAVGGSLIADLQHPEPRIVTRPGRNRPELLGSTADVGHPCSRHREEPHTNFNEIGMRLWADPSLVATLVEHWGSRWICRPVTRDPAGDGRWDSRVASTTRRSARRGCCDGHPRLYRADVPTVVPREARATEWKRYHLGSDQMVSPSPPASSGARATAH
jgi:hypothetical protein